jgi:hypothetical protein
MRSTGGSPWYVHATVRGGRGKQRACAAIAAAGLAFAAAGCGGGERRDAGSTGGSYSVDIVRAQFPARQHLADKPQFVMTVRNAGDATIPNLAVTVHGFSERTSSSTQADPRRLVWLIDEEPPGGVTAIDDTWTAGALAPGATTTLRWHVTPVAAGTHAVRYAVAADLQGAARTSLAGGGTPRGTVTVRVAARPAQARVDPRTGQVIRE